VIQYLFAKLRTGMCTVVQEAQRNLIRPYSRTGIYELLWQYWHWSFSIITATVGQEADSASGAAERFGKALFRSRLHSS
jgi:hypothetical protein